MFRRLSLTLFLLFHRSVSQRICWYVITCPSAPTLSFAFNIMIFFLLTFIRKFLSNFLSLKRKSLKQQFHKKKNKIFFLIIRTLWRRACCGPLQSSLQSLVLQQQDRKLCIVYLWRLQGQRQQLCHGEQLCNCMYR